MQQITVEHLTKTFRVSRRRPGLWGSVRGLLIRDLREVRALDGISFWTTESLEIVNCTTYGGVEAAQFPLTIYRPWFRAIFTFVIPLATINYFPAHAILGLVDPLGSGRLIQWLSPLAGVAFLLVCLRIWRFGVNHYTSTGS